MKRPTLRFGAGVLLSAMLGLPLLLVPLEAQAKTTTILVRQDGFEPSQIEIRPGDKLNWYNDAQTFHSVDAQGDAPQPEPQQLSPQQQTNDVTFNTMKTYQYRMDNQSVFTLNVIVTDNPSSPSPTPSVTGTITITTSPSPTPTKKKTATPTPSRTTATPTPSPSTPTPTPSTPTPTPSPSEPTESASPIPTITGDDSGSSSSGNTQAIIAIVGVLVLGALGFLVYRRTLSRP